MIELNKKIREINIECEQEIKPINLELENEMKRINKEYNDKINPIKSKYRNMKLELFLNAITFKIGDKLHYDCKGSGYYGIYKGIKDEMIVMDICTKGGKLKGGEFITSIWDLCYYTKI